ncbi:MAG: putative two-component system response regulator [Planctomycetota bacterium]|jgi:putative two-component system response regulator
MINDVTTSTRESKHKILFVDDETKILDGLRRILRAETKHWEMTFVDGVDKALEVLAEVDHDAVVSDFNMPVRDGLDLLRTIRSNPDTTDIPVVILTGNGEPEIKRRALDDGATDLLNKPVDRGDLIARLRSVLRLKDYMDQIKNHGKLLEQRVRERTAELEYSRAEVIWRLGKAGEFRDSDTGFHVIRVGLFAQQLARQLKLQEAHIREIFLSAPLHDIGKIGIPDRILLKPGKLTEEEWVVMRSHATIGGQILRARPMAMEHSRTLNELANLDQVTGNAFAEVGAVIAENHHERWDGTGYPLGRQGTDIPISARITSVADVYDALSSKRPYKEAFEEEKVLATMRAQSGKQFDPEVLAAFEDSLPIIRDIQNNFKDVPEGDAKAQADATKAAEDLLKKAG